VNPLEAVLWLTLNIYHEARGEDALGQLAVAHVTLNRARSQGLDVKQVVLEPYQFSWTLQPKKRWWPKDMAALIGCLDVAVTAVAGHDFTRGATHYHQVSVIPEWTNRLEFAGAYGLHNFWREK